MRRLRPAHGEVYADAVGAPVEDAGGAADEEPGAAFARRMRQEYGRAVRG